MVPVVIEQATCIGCGSCVRDCPQCELKLENKKAVFANERCLHCGHCLAICPTGAISMPLEPDEIKPIEERKHLDPEEFHEVLLQRRTIRQYKKDPVAPEVLEQVLDAGRITHSGRNRQGLTFLVLQNDLAEAEAIGVQFFRTIKKIGSPFSSYLKWKQIPDDFFFRGAPLAIVVLGKDKTDAIYAAANMETMAESYGLGTMVTTFFTMAVNHSPALKKYLDIPKDLKAHTTLVMGTPNVKYRRTVSRNSLQAIYR